MNYFEEHEFPRANPPCKLEDMDVAFMEQINLARHLSGVPYKVNSAYRTPQYEQAMGRNGKSAHCKGKAMDIHCIDSHSRFLIIKGLILAGFTRIFTYDTFIHADTDTDQVQEVMRYYP